MPPLPVLTAANAGSEAEWHEYIRSVYHQRIGAGMRVDLNELTWFYARGAPVQRLLRETPCLQVCTATSTPRRPSNVQARRAARACRVLSLRLCAILGWPSRVAVPDDVYEGTLWTGGYGPEALWPALGFFVSRATPLPEAVPDCAHLEVMHVHTSFNGEETGVSWFFHTVGSGARARHVHIDLPHHHRFPSICEKRSYVCSVLRACGFGRTHTQASSSTATTCPELGALPRIPTARGSPTTRMTVRAAPRSHGGWTRTASRCSSSYVRTDSTLRPGAALVLSSRLSGRACSDPDFADGGQLLDA